MIFLDKVLVKISFLSKKDFYVSKIAFLILITKLAFKKYPKLYITMFFSLISILLEIIAMSLISSISNDKYIFYTDYLSSLDKKLLFLIVIFLFTIRFVSLFFIENYQVYIARKFQSYLSVTALKQTYLSELLDIERKKIGFFISLAGDEASRASEILNAMLKLFNFIVLFFLYLFILIYFDLKVAVLISVLFLVSSAAISFVVKKSSDIGSISLTEGRNARSIFIDGLNGLKTIKSFGIENFMSDKYESVLYRYLMTNYKLFFLSLLNRFIPIIVFFILFALYIIIDCFDKNILTTMYLVTLFFIIMRFLLNLGDLLHTVNKIFGDLKAAEDIISFIHTPNPSKGKISIPSKINFIKFDNIRFYYKKNVVIFNNLQLEFTSNRSYAVIGKTGSGKSTLIDLMMHFLTPIDGKILINGIDSNELDPKALKEKIIYISQESIIFNDTVRNNLNLDKVYSDEKIKEALELVGLTDMISNFDDGLDHILHYKGTNISGGQKQRLNIARAILRNPDVLILDESLNALDTKTRMKIVSNLINIYKNKIIIFITHDTDILKMTDVVIDLDVYTHQKRLKISNED